MAKYRFKWWHGLLGLVGLGMVAGTVKAIAAPKGQSVSQYRGFQIVIVEEQRSQSFPSRFFWSVQETKGNSTIELALGERGTREAAVLAAHDAVDRYIMFGSIT